MTDLHFDAAEREAIETVSGLILDRGCHTSAEHKRDIALLIAALVEWRRRNGDTDSLADVIRGNPIVETARGEMPMVDALTDPVLTHDALDYIRGALAA